jgi:pimeloyl-ACP methyl ester carboxylesterase
MVTFHAGDGTALAHHPAGTGAPLVCVPGGPMQSAAYLRDLGGLTAHRALVCLDPRGTGDSAIPGDPATYRYDRQVGDVEALREHLGLDRIDLLGHSAGGSIAVRYVGRLVLVCPSPRVVGIEVADADRAEVTRPRAGEPWFPAAIAAFERIWAGSPTAADWAAISPFSHGSWDDAARELEAESDRNRNNEAAAAYYGPGTPDPAQTRAALAALTAPVLLLCGEYDVGLPPRRAAEYADLFPGGRTAVAPRAGHFPWYDDPEWFRATVADFLSPQ